MVNLRAKMRRSHRKAIRWLLNNSFDMVYIIQHTRHDSTTYFKNEKVKSKDIAGLFDGIALKNGKTFFVQIKSNAFPSKKRYEKFAEKYKVNIILVNVPDRKPIKVKVIQ